MNKDIEQLKSTTFAGHRFTRKQLIQIQQTANTFKNLSLRELGHTICEHLNWYTPGGKHKIQLCLTALEEMQEVGLFKLPEKVKQSKGTLKPIEWTSRTDQPSSELSVTLEQLSPLSIQKVTEKEDIELWNEYVARYHYLGYKRPIGTHLRYFIVSQTNEKQILGCLIFSFPVWSLACRDHWIGWDETQRKRHLNLILNNNRFLIFPWVKVRNLASKALSLATKQVAEDWMEHFGYSPVLIETFVDPQKFTGTSYKSANWTFIGKTEGKSGKARENKEAKKQVYVYPLVSNFRDILMNNKKQQEKKKNYKNKQPSTMDINDPFIILWQHIIDIIFNVAQEFDQKWQKRKRIINTMLLILFIFRLVFSKNKQGYGITIVELWEQCQLMNIALPQEKPVAQSAFSNARKKLDEDIFKAINTQVIKKYDSQVNEQRWKGHRLFGVDGTKINLPRQLLNKPYKTPSDNAYYPQGLVSCLYQLKSKIPYDFDLVSHYNERTVALSHLKLLHKQDIVVYDRGYFSYAMLYYHLDAGIEGIFQLQQNNTKVIDEFFQGDQVDNIVELNVSSKQQKEILSKYPDIQYKPLRLRLIKYVYCDTTYVLGTTLLDNKQYQISELCDIYHSRWGIEELYKVSKSLIDVEEFHAYSERGVKQELFAHFVLITLNRIFTNHVEQEVNIEHETSVYEDNLKTDPKFRVNIKNALVIMARQLESLFFQKAKELTGTINNIVQSISFCKQKERPGRQFERSSHKPVKKWKPSKNIPTAKAA